MNSLMVISWSSDGTSGLNGLKGVNGSKDIVDGVSKSGIKVCESDLPNERPYIYTIIEGKSELPHPALFDCSPHLPFFDIPFF